MLTEGHDFGGGVRDERLHTAACQSREEESELGVGRQRWLD